MVRRERGTHGARASSRVSKAHCAHQSTRPEPVGSDECDVVGAGDEAGRRQKYTEIKAQERRNDPRRFRKCGQRQSCRLGLDRLPAHGEIQWPLAYRQCTMGTKAQREMNTGQLTLSWLPAIALPSH